MESVDGGSDSIEVVPRLSRPEREVAECCYSLSCNRDHEDTFFQGDFLPPCVATVTSALCVEHFCEEDGGS